MLVDAHLHIFESVNGFGAHGPIHSASHGHVSNRTGQHRFLPAYFKHTAFDIEAAVQLLNDHGVKHAVLMQNVFIGTRNLEIAAALDRFPGRFQGVIQVDPTTLYAAECINEFIGRPDMKIIKFEMSEGWGWTGIYPELRLDGPEMAPLWKIAADEGGSVIIDPGPPFNRGYQIDAIEQLAKQYPSVPIIVEHLAYLTEKTSKSPRHLAEWRRMWRLAHHKNVYLGLSAAGSLLEDVYPCQTMRRRMREVYKEIGPQKLLWGTDAPVTLNMYTYTQMQDMHRTEMDFLSTDDRKLIMGGNALRLWWAKQS